MAKTTLGEESKVENIILTGDRPTGPLHLGHYVGSLRQRVELQHAYRQFIIIADAQALTDNADNPDMIRKNILEVTLDYLAIGIKALLSSVSRLPGTDGKGKMSKSLGNVISLCDSADVVRKKVKMMFTDPNHLQVSDPGRVEGNPVFAYLDSFDPDKTGLDARSQ